MVEGFELFGHIAIQDLVLAGQAILSQLKGLQGGSKRVILAGKHALFSFIAQCLDLVTGIEDASEPMLMALCAFHTQVDIGLVSVPAILAQVLQVVSRMLLALDGHSPVGGHIRLGMALAFRVIVLLHMRDLGLLADEFRGHVHVFVLLCCVDDQMAEIQGDSLLVADRAHDAVLRFQGTLVIDCDYLAGTLEARMVLASQVDGLRGLSVAQGALEVLHYVKYANSYYLLIYPICIPQCIIMKNKNSTIDLHNIKEDIYLGFLAEEVLIKPTVQVSFFGGEPVWLRQPTQAQQKCPSCNVNLCFMGQLYCPFEADHCYHRILYFLFCDKCIREFKCIRQQADKDWQSTQQIKSNVRKVCEAYEIENDSFSRNELIKLMARVKMQIEEDDAIEEAESQDEEDVMNEVDNLAGQEFKKYEGKEDIQEKGMMKQEQQRQDNNKDILFEVYRKAIVELNCPCLLYTDIPLLYNKRTLNPQHFCKCGSKLSLEVQITQKVLSMDNDPNSKLLLMDWGSIFIYTCSASCDESSEECVVVQYEIDAITDEDIKKLNKKKKNKKKSEKKSKSKSKSKEKGKEDESSENQKNVAQENPAKKEENGGDWD